MSMMNSGYSDMQGPTVSKKQNKNPNPKAGPGLIRRMFQVDGASVALVFVILIVVFNK